MHTCKHSAVPWLKASTAVHICSVRHVWDGQTTETLVVWTACDSPPLSLSSEVWRRTSAWSEASSSGGGSTPNSRKRSVWCSDPFNLGHLVGEDRTKNGTTVFGQIDWFGFRSAVRADTKRLLLNQYELDVFPMETRTAQNHRVMLWETLACLGSESTFIFWFASTFWVS